MYGGTLLGCFFVAMGCGTLYVYSAYAPQLSEKLGLTATQMSNIGMVGNLAMALSGPLAGHMVDSYGFRGPILVSLLSNFFGYTVVRLCYVNTLASMPLLMLALLTIGIGSSFAFSSTVKCAAVNFPEQRGMATSVAMAGYGLSAFVISALARRTVPGDTTGFLSLLAFFPSALFIIFGPVVAAAEPAGLYGAAASSSATTGSHLERHVDPPIAMHHIGHDDEYLGLVTVDGLTEQGVAARLPSTNRDITGARMLRQRSFWCYSIMLGFLAGMGQTYIYTCGYMVKALAVNEDEHAWQAAQVATISVANCAGRILSGVLSDGFKVKLHQSRTWVLLVAIGFCVAAEIISRVITRVQLMTLLSTLNGMFYGLCFGSYPGILSDAFGLKHFSANWGLLALSPVPVAYALTVRMGRLYDAQSRDGICTGAKCFKDAFPLHIGLATVLIGVLFYAVHLEKGPRRAKASGPIY